MQALSPTMVKTVELKWYTNQIETFLTCRKLAEYLRETLLDEASGNFFEERALEALYKALNQQITIADVEMILLEMPQILNLNYPVVDKIRKVCMLLISQLKDSLREDIAATCKWQMYLPFNEFDYLMNMLKTFDNYNHNKT